MVDFEKYLKTATKNKIVEQIKYVIKWHIYQRIKGIGYLYWYQMWCISQIDWWNSANFLYILRPHVFTFWPGGDFVISGCASERRVGIDSRLKRWGQGLKTWGKATNKPQARSQLVDQSMGAQRRQNKRVLFLASHIQSEWCGHRWHGVRGHMAKYGSRIHEPSSYWTLSSCCFFYTVQAVEVGGEKPTSWERCDGVKLKYLSTVAEPAKKVRNSSAAFESTFFKQRKSMVFMNLWEDIKGRWSTCKPSLTWIIKSVDVAHASHLAIIV